MGYGSKEIKINVSKGLLLEKLTHNREEFVKKYKIAKKGYRASLITELESKLLAAKSGHKVDLSFKNQPPKNQTSDYDDIIGMLEWSTDETVELNQEQYKNYIDDKWDWYGHWSLSNSNYLSMSGDM